MPVDIREYNEAFLDRPTVQFSIPGIAELWNMVPSLEFPRWDVEAVEPDMIQRTLLSLESLNIGSQGSTKPSLVEDARSANGSPFSRIGTFGSGSSNISRSRSPPMAMDRLQGGPSNAEATLPMERDDASDMSLTPESSSAEVVAKLLHAGKDNPFKPSMSGRRHSVASVLTSRLSERPSTSAHEGCFCHTLSVV